MATTTTTLSDEATKAVDDIEETRGGAQQHRRRRRRGQDRRERGRHPDPGRGRDHPVRYRRGRSPAQGGSDEMLSAGTTLTFGLAIGLLIGGANRLLVAAALVPVAAMGLTLLGRANGRSRKEPKNS